MKQSHISIVQTVIVVALSAEATVESTFTSTAEGAVRDLASPLLRPHSAATLVHTSFAPAFHPRRQATPKCVPLSNNYRFEDDDIDSR